MSKREFNKKLSSELESIWLEILKEIQTEINKAKMFKYIFKSKIIEIRKNLNSIEIWVKIFKWCHIVIDKKSQSCFVYVNGKLVC